jgi:hypothetical protein
MVVAAMLLHNMPEPSNPKARRAHDEIRELALEHPAEPPRQEREASVHPEHAQRNKAVSVRECIVDKP